MATGKKLSSSFTIKDIKLVRSVRGGARLRGINPDAMPLASLIRMALLQWSKGPNSADRG